VQTSYGYDATGNTTTSGTASTNSYEYTGRQNDSTGYYYYRARYYNPQIGRFLAEDPLEFGGGDANIYRYAGGNPISSRDPLGFCSEPALEPVGGPPNPEKPKSSCTSALESCLAAGVSGTACGKAYVICIDAYYVWVKTRAVEVIIFPDGSYVDFPGGIP
jgi:RHS repeat-associated protein